MKFFFLPNQLIRATKSCLLIWALKISKLFSKMLMSRALTRGQKLLKIGIFMKIDCFLLKYFYIQLLACSVIYPWKDLLTLRRMVYTSGAQRPARAAPPPPRPRAGGAP